MYIVQKWPELWYLKNALQITTFFNSFPPDAETAFLLKLPHQIAPEFASISATIGEVAQSGWASIPALDLAAT